MRLGQPGQQQPQGVDTRVDYELYDRTTNAVIDTFPARNDDEARVRLDDYRSWPGASNPDNFGVRRAGRPAATAPAPGTEQYYDVTWTDGGSESHMRVRAVTATGAMYMVRSHLQRQGIGAENIEAQVSAQQHAPGSTVDLQRQRAAQAPAPQPAAGETFTGEWRIVDGNTGQELHRFSGIGNNQRDANRVAANWLSQNAPDAEMTDIEVYPVMAESLREYRMPQPSQGPGKYRDLNEPLGPETPPTMPAGTVKVDVSDVYDWYKLGQHISNMKDLGQHDFGQGPPSAILSFGDEDLEHRYIQALKQTGLTTTDIDPVDPDQPPGMPRQKTDPTYNVDENSAGGINKMFNNLGDPVYANLQRVALLAMQGRQQEAAGRLQSVIKSASPGIQKKIIDAVNNIKPVTINGKIADSSTLDKSKQHQDWILNTFIPWVQSLLGQQGVAENFADGKNPGRKGLSKRVGVNTKASVSDLRKTAKNSSGEKQRMAHWLANMKAGRAKAKKK
jgi:hypothetical protein